MKQCFLAFALASIAFPASASEWFPRHPGNGEKQYIVYHDICGENPPIGRPVLKLLQRDAGRWRLEITQTTPPGFCLGTPPPGSARFYAFEIPAQIGGVAITQVDLVTPAEGTTPLIRPGSVTTPASITGTWTLPGARHQGLLITQDETGRLAVSLNTYDAQGRPAWYSGSATSAPDVVTVPLTDTVAGAFLATPAGAAQVRAWGEIDIDWQACGSLRATWRPAAGTGLAAGSGTFSQLTGDISAPCNLATYAAAGNGQPQYVEYDIDD